MTNPDPIDLGRMQSNLLTQVRTVLSRAETALGGGDWINDELLCLKSGKWLEHEGRDPIPHPEREEIRAALEQVVELLSPWRRTGTSRNRDKI